MELPNQNLNEVADLMGHPVICSTIAALATLLNSEVSYQVTRKGSLLYLIMHLVKLFHDKHEVHQTFAAYSNAYNVTIMTVCLTGDGAWRAVNNSLMMKLKSPGFSITSFCPFLVP